jgi:hypothetical protein
MWFRLVNEVRCPYVRVSSGYPSAWSWLFSVYHEINIYVCVSILHTPWGVFAYPREYAYPRLNTTGLGCAFLCSVALRLDTVFVVGLTGAALKQCLWNYWIAKEGQEYRQKRKDNFTFQTIAPSVVWLQNGGEGCGTNLIYICYVA